MTGSARWAVRVGVVGLVGVALLGGARAASAQSEGAVFQAGAMEVRIGGRVQTQFNTTTADDEPESEIFLRRVRFDATVRVNRLVSGKVQPEFAGDKVSVKDAYLKLDFTPGIQLLAGKAYRPFGLLEQTSSTRILPIERGLSIRGAEGLDEYEIAHDLGYGDRDVGFQVMGAPRDAPLGLSYAAGVFSGPLAGETGNATTYQYAGRATLRPFPAVAVGGAWSNRAFSRPDGGGFEIERGNAFEVDVEIGTFAPGLHLLAEASFGDFDPFDGSDFAAAQAWLGYRIPPVGEAISAIEPIFRASRSRIDGTPEDLDGTLLTPGINVYFGGLNRVMLNYDAWLPDGPGPDQGSLRAQFQLAF